MSYAEHFHCAFLFNPDIRKVLFIGLGGGTGPTQFFHFYPQMLIDAVEIDPEVIRVAERFFHLPTHRRLRIIQSDGREFVRKTRRRYDLIVVDAYLTAGKVNLIPPHLTTLEFFREAKRRLTSGGMLCYNVIGMFSGRSCAMPLAVAKTLSVVFPSIHAFDVQTSENTVLFATVLKDAVRKSTLMDRARRLQACGMTPLPSLVSRAESYHADSLRLEDAYLLTDADAPVEKLLAEK